MRLLFLLHGKNRFAKLKIFDGANNLRFQKLLYVWVISAENFSFKKT